MYYLACCTCTHICHYILSEEDLQKLAHGGLFCFFKLTTLQLANSCLAGKFCKLN